MNTFSTIRSNSDDGKKWCKTSTTSEEKSPDIYYGYVLQTLFCLFTLINFLSFKVYAAQMIKKRNRTAKNILPAAGLFRAGTRDWTGGL